MDNNRQWEMEADRVETILAAHEMPGRVTAGTVSPDTVRFRLKLQPQVHFSAVRALESDLAQGLRMASCQFRKMDDVILECRFLELRLPSVDSLISQAGPLPPVTALLGFTEGACPLWVRLPAPCIQHIFISGAVAVRVDLVRTIALSLIFQDLDMLVGLTCREDERLWDLLHTAPCFTPSGLNPEDLSLVMVATNVSDRDVESLLASLPSGRGYLVAAGPQFSGEEPGLHITAPSEGLCVVEAKPNVPEVRFWPVPADEDWARSVVVGTQPITPVIKPATAGAHNG